MKNTIIHKLDNIVEVRIKGKNIHNYIKRSIIKNKINILKLTYINYKEALLIINYKDYLKLREHRSIYDISIVNKYGKLRIKDKLKKNYILLASIFIGITVILFLSRIIFSIEVIHSDKDIRELLYKELNKYGIEKYNFKKNYNELENIEDKILEDNKDKLEWIEIIESGTKYIVKVEERKINTIDKVYKYQSIISNKDCIIYEVNAKSGVIVKNKLDYVKKGEAIISGYITLPDNSNKLTVALGEVLGEVWYTIDINYPYAYYEEKLTGNSKKVYVINFLNHKFSLFNFNKYHSFNSKSKILLKSDTGIFNFSLDKQYEVKIINNIYTYEEAMDKAIEEGKNKLLLDNNKIKELKDIDIIGEYDNGDYISLKIFVKAIENIGEIQEIAEENQNT